MATKRLRVFAGPNGSGKSTYINKVKEEPPAPNFKLGYYINADDIQRILIVNRKLYLDELGLSFSTRKIRSYFKHSQFAPVKLKIPDLFQHFTVRDNVLYIDDSLQVNSYIAADLAEFFRHLLLKDGKSFSFETVMSDENKVRFLKLAKRRGYKVYLYYFSTEDPEINISRVALRVEQHGHDVPTTAIRSRYYRSLSNLKSAIKTTERAYLFDSSEMSLLVASITKGNDVELADQENVPNWFVDYVMN